MANPGFFDRYNKANGHLVDSGDTERLTKLAVQAPPNSPAAKVASVGIPEPTLTGLCTKCQTVQDDVMFGLCIPCDPNA